mmetsp:Transcript_17862/g.30329  ORF Transcript_17862/g.30329 Transcript_17862/m.30329 type:complete len:104 (+) Transcript_17862:1287-1598(+)
MKQINSFNDCVHSQFSKVQAKFNKVVKLYDPKKGQRKLTNNELSRGLVSRVSKRKLDTVEEGKRRESTSVRKSVKMDDAMPARKRLSSALQIDSGLQQLQEEK